MFFKKSLTNKSFLLLLVANIIFNFIVLLIIFYTKTARNEYVLIFVVLPLCVFNVYFVGWKYIKNAYLELFVVKRIRKNILIFLSLQLSFIFILLEIIVIISPNIHRDIYFSYSILAVVFFANSIFKIGDLCYIWLESINNQALDSIKKLQPLKTIILRNNEFVEVLVSQVRKGDIIKVLPGEFIPIDGVVLSKQASIEFNNLTSDPRQLHIYNKNHIYAGMKNIGPEFLIEAICTHNCNAIAEIVKNISKMQKADKGIQKKVNFALNFVAPLIICISLIAFLMSYFIFNANNDNRFNQSFQIIISVLLASSFTSLLASVPSAILAGSSKIIKKGILINNPNVFENFHKLNAILLDKTGMLTKGEIELIEYYGKEEYLPLIGAFESHIHHPISSGIQRFLTKNNIPYDINLKVHDYELLTFSFLSDYFEIIKYSKFKNAGLHPEINLHQTKMTSSLLYKNGNLVAQLIFKDEIEKTAIKEIENLKNRKLKVSLLTDDNFYIAESFANNFKIDNFYANTTPDKKLLIVLEKQMDNDKVIFIGDPSQDSLALKQADMSIAVFSKFSQLNSKFDVIVLEPNLNLITQTLDEILKVRKMIFLNLAWAISLNCLLVVFATFGLMFPIIFVIMSFLLPIPIFINAKLFQKRK